MRILSFSCKWQKLSQPEFTTFRFPRKDRDWAIGEVVQVYYKNRSPQREKLFEAKILNKLSKLIGMIGDWDAHEDGFANATEMRFWLNKTYGLQKTGSFERMNKLTLRRVARTEG